jgi:ribulose-phosphate 3-epimerase
LAVKISPSILSCDFLKLGLEIQTVEKAGADWIHVDVMDGHFVENLTIGPPVISSLKKITNLPLDVHLMIESPEKSIDQYLKAGASFLTIHVEATDKVAESLKVIRDGGARAGITMRPTTEISKIEKYLDLVDLVLVMTVNPGWSGQAFMTEQIEKIKFLKSWSIKHNPNLFIEVDGGINPDTARKCREAGANAFVAGHAIFKTKDYSESISAIRGE